MIEDSLFLKNDILDKKLIVTCSSKPNSELKVSQLIHTEVSGKKSYQFAALAQSKESLNGNESFGCLSYNPAQNEYICSTGLLSNGSEEDGASSATDMGILLWKLDQSILSSSDFASSKKANSLPNKRMKTGAGISYIAPSAKIVCGGGIESLKWSSPGRIIAGCRDHCVKLVSVEKQ